MLNKEERAIDDFKFFISNHLNLAAARVNVISDLSAIKVNNVASNFAAWEGIIENWWMRFSTKPAELYCTSPVIHVISEFAIERLELGSWAHIRNTKPPCKEKPHFQANKNDLVGAVSPLSSSAKKTIFSDISKHSCLPTDSASTYTVARMYQNDLIEDYIRKSKEHSYQSNATTDKKQNIMNGTNNKMKLELTRPVMVGDINILTASDETLTLLIRNAKAQIEEDSDMAKISAKFKAKAKDLKSVIALCLKQLDSGVVEEKPSA